MLLLARSPMQVEEQAVHSWFDSIASLALPVPFHMSGGNWVRCGAQRRCLEYKAMRMPRLLFAIFALLAIPALLPAAGQSKASGGSSDIKFVVVKDDSGKPVRNASVILHPVGHSGKQAKGGFQLKTDAEGKTETDGIPYGMLRVQVIAPGFQTFGDDYTVDQPEQVVTIRLKRPQDQYTIYDKPDSGQPKDKQ